MIVRLLLIVRLIEQRARYRMALEAIKAVVDGQYDADLKRSKVARIANEALS